MADTGSQKDKGEQKARPTLPPDLIKEDWFSPERVKKGEEVWTLPEIPGVIKTTEGKINIIFDIDQNRMRVLNEVAIALSDIIKNLESTIGKRNLTTISDGTLMKEVNVAKKAVKEHPYIKNLLPLPVIARVLYVYQELTNIIQTITDLNEQNDITELDKALEKYRLFHDSILNEFLDGIENFIRGYQHGGLVFEDINEVLDSALKIPGYPIDSIRAVYTKYKKPSEEGPDIKYYYEYYRDKRYSPEELKAVKERILTERNNRVHDLDEERNGLFIKVLKRIKDKKLFVDFLKDENITEENIDSPQAVNKLLSTNFLQSMAFYEAAEKQKLFDDKEVTDTLAEISSLQNKINFLNSKSEDELMEDKLFNANFKKLVTGEISFSEMLEFYKKWREVKDHL